MKKTDLVKALDATISRMGSSSVMFDGNVIASIGDNINILYPLESGITCTVVAGDLLNSVSKMGDELALTVKEDKLVVSDKRTRLKLKFLPEGDAAELRNSVSNMRQISEGAEWKDLPKTFFTALVLSLFSAGKDSELGKISGVAINGTELLSTDNFRISHYTMDSSVMEKMFRLKTTVVEKIVRLGEFNWVGIRNEYLLLRNKSGVIVTATLMDSVEQYPFDRVLGGFDAMKFGESTVSGELPKDIVSSIERVEPMAAESELDYTTQIEIEQTEPGTLTLRASKETGEIEDTISWDGVLPAKIVGSPGFLKKILLTTRRFTLSPIRKALLFEAPNFRYMMLAKIGAKNG